MFVYIYICYISFYTNIIIFIYNYLTVCTVIIFLIFMTFLSFICLFLNFSYLKEEKI